ncbi:MAG: tellurite resistance TerB family protein [Rhodobiaceae bacterium]|nr:tellurite resistance TerB family protein [Rhodobiaceae bacterium]
MNPTALIDQLMSGLSGRMQSQSDGQGSGAGFPGGTAGVAAAAGVAGLLLGSKKGRKMMGTAAKYGGVAVLGGLAYRAWQKHQEGAGAPLPPSPVDDTFTPPGDDRFLPDTVERDDLPMALLRAMIAAAKADGHVDSTEQSRIFDAIGASELASGDKALLFDELNRPLDPDAVAALAKTPEMAAEIYTASVVVIGDMNPDERRYLDRLAGRLGLEAGLQDTIETEAAALPTG